MRKQSKSLISMILAAAMVVTLGTGTGVGRKADAADAAATPINPSFQAFLCQNNSGIFTSTLAVKADGSATTTEDKEKVADGVVATSGAITETGTYTLSAVVENDMDDILSPDEGAKYLGLEFGKLGETKVGDLTNYNLPSTFSIKPKEIKIEHIDGSADTVLDWSKAVVYNNGNKPTEKLRIGIINQYANSMSSSKLDESQKANPFWTNSAGTWVTDEPVSAAMGDTFSVTFEVTGDVPQITQPPKQTATPTAPPAAKSYKGYLGFQTDNFIFRDQWYKTDSNKNYKHDTQICVAEKKARAVDAKMTNVEIKDNATYTVGISGVNLKTLKNNERLDDKGNLAELATQFNMVYLDTNIPTAMKGVSAVNATLKIDGQVVKSGMTLPLKPDAEEAYYQLMVADAYSDTNPGAYEKSVPYPKANPLKILPTSSIELTFTMKGVNFQQDFSKKTIGVKKGKTFTSGNFKYKVTKAATMTAGKKTQGTVSVVGLTKKGKKASKLSVGKTVSKTVSKVKATYKINKLGNNAFKGAKAKSATLSKNIKSIPKGAFANCKKLSTLTLKAKISVKKGAFKGCKKTIKVKGTSKKANLKKLKKCGYKKFK